MIQELPVKQELEVVDYFLVYSKIDLYEHSVRGIMVHVLKHVFANQTMK